MPEARRGSASTLARAVRAKSVPLVWAPVAVGAALAGARGAMLGAVDLALTFAGASALHLGAMAFNDAFDARTGADRMARIDRGGITTASGVIEEGLLSERAMRVIGAILFAVAAAAGAWLAARTGRPGLLALGALGAVLGFGYCGPPLRYGYLGRGLGQVGVFVAYGPLAAAGSYAAAARAITSDALWAGLVPGLFTAMAVYHHDLLHHKPDRAVRKMTPVVVLGPEAALIVSGFVMAATYAALVVQVATGLFPAWSLASLVTAPAVAAAWTRAFADPLPQACLALFGATLGAAVVASLAIALSLALG